MCLPFHQRSRREKGLVSLACLCLAISMASRSMNLTFGLRPGALDFLEGLLLGVSITLNLGVVLMRKRRVQQAPGV
jgi:hypothetical protein